MQLIDEVLLDKPREKGFVVNPLKCEWAFQDTDFLGHWLIPKGVNPWSKKIKAIPVMQSP